MSIRDFGLFLMSICSISAMAADLDPHEPIMPNSEVAFVVTGVQPGARVRFVAGRQLGDGPCPAVLQGLCLDVTNPVTLGVATASSRGHAVLVKEFGPNVPVDILFTQAAGRDATGPFTTNIQISEPAVCTCPAVWAPVCGVNGETYGNECEASCEQVEVSYEGECESCVCPEVYLPVCGADGMTYSNECHATCGQVPVAYEGECEDCFCPDVWLPVCGVDGETYGNACEAECANVAIGPDSACP